jgi:mono/diheme cytochrome c family protein
LAKNSNSFGQKFEAKRNRRSGTRAAAEGRVSRISRSAQWVIGAVVWMAACPAQAQSNLDAGKSPAQIFADTCNACHRSARELKQTNARFLLEHYTTGGREAAAMAAYLASVGSDPRAVQQRRPPALGAGQAATTTARQTPPATDQGRQPETQAALPALNLRRPSESVEAGALPIDAPRGRGAEAASPQAATAPIRSNGLEEFEE